MKLNPSDILRLGQSSANTTGTLRMRIAELEAERDEYERQAWRWKASHFHWKHRCRVAANVIIAQAVVIMGGTTAWAWWCLA